jgi:hypothetical protein
VRYDLPDAVASITRIAQKHGGELRAELREPATGAEITACEEVFGFPLPPSQREFLTTHNGALLRALGRRGRMDDHPTPIPAYRLDLFGTPEILWHARDLQDRFELYYTGEEPWLATWRAKMFVACAALYDGDPRVLLAADRPTEDGEFAVIGVSVATTNWVAEKTEYEAAERALMESQGYLFEPAQVLASSFGEFVERSLQAMIEHERGFDYMELDDENLWEKR